MKSNHLTNNCINNLVLSYPSYVVYNGYHKWPWLHYMYSCFILHAQRQGLKRNLLLTAYNLCIVFGVLISTQNALASRALPQTPMGGGGGGVPALPHTPCLHGRGVPSPWRRGNHRYWPLHFIFPSYATMISLFEPVLNSPVLFKSLWSDSKCQRQIRSQVVCWTLGGGGGGGCKAGYKWTQPEV